MTLCAFCHQCSGGGRGRHCPKGSQQGRLPDGPTKTQPGPVARQPPPSLHGRQPLCCLASPARVHRRTHAHEPHRSTPDALAEGFRSAVGTAWPRCCLARGCPAPAKSVARRILRAWSASFTFNGITAYGDGERDALLELCYHRKPISGSIKVLVHRCARGRCAWCRGSREFVKMRPRRT